MDTLDKGKAFTLISKYRKKCRIQREALDAIYARINGVYDDPSLVKFGELTPSVRKDTQHILEVTEERIKEI